MVRVPRSIARSVGRGTIHRALFFFLSGIAAGSRTRDVTNTKGSGGKEYASGEENPGNENRGATRKRRSLRNECEKWSREKN
jgi:hypothetical protein